MAVSPVTTVHTQDQIQMATLSSPWARSSSSRFRGGSGRPQTAPPANGVSIPRTLARKLAVAAQNRQSKDQTKEQCEAIRQLKSTRAQALHAQVQHDRRLNEGKHLASVAACKDKKLMASQEARMVLREAIDVTSELLQNQIDAKVLRAKAHAAGKVAASRQRLLEKNRASRQEVGLDQQYALDEKARRLQQVNETATAHVLEIGGRACPEDILMRHIPPC